jgi:hypothetical protein
MELRVTVIPQRNPMTPPERLPYPTRSHSPHYSVAPSHNTTPTYRTLPPVTQTDTMHKAGLTPANESANQTQERTVL